MKKEKHSAMRYFRWTAILLCLIGITACRQDTPRFRIGVAQCSDDSWRHKMNDEILREAMFYDGVSVEIRSAGDDNRRQAEDIHYFMDKGVDLLIISANEAAPMTPIVEEAYRKGIPVITVDRKILSDKYTAYIGADNYEIGRAVGNYIASRLKGKGNIVELTGLSGSTPAMERHQGFMAAISHFPEIKLIDKADAAWERGPAEVEMDSMLRRHSKIDAVYAHNDRIAPGAYQAAKKAGREKEMIFVGIDALPGKGNGLELVLDSVLDATFIYPTNGDKVLQLAMNILEKKSYPRETVMNTAVVDRTNAHIMQLQTTHISELDQKIETLNGRISGYLSRVATQQVIMYGSLLILLLVAGLLLVVYKSLRSKNRLNRELSEQKKQLEEQRDKLEEQRDQLIQLSHQLEEATHAKLVFFTNISHDFRTPLTLVADPVEQLLADRTLTGDQHRMLLLIQRNVNILLRLVNQILDFRKYENGKMEYTPVPVNILSSFLLSSDLQGYVEAPSFYFSSDDSRTSYLLDLLMLTQGWVKYSLVPDRGSFPVERSQCVSGKVVSEYSEKKCIADAVVTLFSFDKKIMRQTTSDASGCFRFDSLSFPRGTHFILQARKKKGGTDVALLVDRDSVPSVHSSLPVYADWFRAEMDEPVVSEQSGNDPSPTSANVFQRPSTAPFSMEQYLDEVVVSTKKIEKKKRYAIESLMAHSDWNKTYHVDEMTLSPYSSTKDLLINTPGVGWAVDSNSGDFFYITRLRAGRSSTPPPALLMVDGLETSYSELVGIPVSIVESIELVKDAAQMAYIGSKASNGAILISTKSGLGTVGKKASNFRIIRPIGYQVKRESYSPSYPVVYGAINNGGNSFRTIYWSPDLLLDKAASHLEFGNPKQGRLTLVVQGITPDGKLINLTRTLGNE